MNLNYYQKQAATTAVYPSSARISYPALGLCNEIGEWMENPENLDELGDVMWYVAALATDLGFSLEDCMSPVLGAGIKFTMVAQAARIAGRVKKILRGDLCNYTSDIKNSLGIIIHAVSTFAHIKGKDLDDICQSNLDKLFDRKDRGVIKGDGDNR